MMAPQGGAPIGIDAPPMDQNAPQMVPTSLTDELGKRHEAYIVKVAAEQTDIIRQHALEAQMSKKQK